MTFAGVDQDEGLSKMLDSDESSDEDKDKDKDKTRTKRYRKGQIMYDMSPLLKELYKWGYLINEDV